MRAITKAQRRALFNLYERDLQAQVQSVREGRKARLALRSYRAFRKTAIISFGSLMIPLWGMWIGIEPDGYTHS